MIDLSDITAKMERAKEHIRDLDREVQDFLLSRPFELTREVVDGGRQHIFRFHFNLEIPMHLACVAGDAVHNMRSALDHLSRRLVVASGSTPTRQTEFPIFRRHNEFLKGSKGKVAGMSTAIVEAIEALQPYHLKRPDGQETATWHPLWILHDLDRIDKHQGLNVTAVALPRIGGFPMNIAGLKVHMPGLAARDLVEGDTVAELYFPEAHPDPSFNISIASQVALAAVPSFAPEPMTVTLARIFGALNEQILPPILGLLT